MSFLERIRERKIVQWSLAYLAGAWLVLEVFSTLQDGLGWPAVLFPILVTLIVVGLVITLVIAWYHGEQGRQRVSGAELLIIAGLLLVAGLLSARFLETGDPEGAAVAAAEEAEPGPSRTSLAVLPFTNRSGREEDRPFVDGLHDEVLTQLRKIRSLELNSLTSVLEYRDSPKNARLISQELGARYIVEGSVQRVGDRVRMRVSLVDGLEDRRIWGDEIDREYTVAGLLDLQRDIALNIATQVGAQVLPHERDVLQVEAPDNLAAYERYLEGLAHLRVIGWNVGDQTAAYDGAIRNLTAAIAEEPAWAPPHAALGMVRHYMASRGVDPETNWPASKAELETALRLDSLYAPAWSSLGYVRSTWERDVEGAEAAYRRTRDGPPGIILLGWGRFDAAVATFERELERDPRSRQLQGQLGWAYVCQGDFERAVEAIQRRLDMADEPDWTFRWLQAYAQLKLGREQEAMADIGGMRDGGVSNEMLALLYALADSTEQAVSFLDAVDEARPAPVLAEFAAAAVVLGQRDRALSYLERAAETTPEGLVHMRCLEEVRSLSDDPRYDRVLERVWGPAAADF